MCSVQRPGYHPAVRADETLVRRETSLHCHVSRSVRRRPVHGLDVRRKHVVATSEEPGRQELVIVVEDVRRAVLRPQPLSIDEEVDFGHGVAGGRLRHHPPGHRTRKSRAVCNGHRHRRCRRRARLAPGRARGPARRWLTPPANRPGRIGGTSGPHCARRVGGCRWPKMRVCSSCPNGDVGSHMASGCGLLAASVDGFARADS